MYIHIANMHILTVVSALVCMLILCTHANMHVLMQYVCMHVCMYKCKYVYIVLNKTMAFHDKPPATWVLH